MAGRFYSLNIVAVHAGMVVNVIPSIMIAFYNFPQYCLLPIDHWHCGAAKFIIMMSVPQCSLQAVGDAHPVAHQGPPDPNLELGCHALAVLLTLRPPPASAKSGRSAVCWVF